MKLFQCFEKALWTARNISVKSSRTIEHPTFSAEQGIVVLVPLDDMPLQFRKRASVSFGKLLDMYADTQRRFHRLTGRDNRRLRELIMNIAACCWDFAHAGEDEISEEDETFLLTYGRHMKEVLLDNTVDNAFGIYIVDDIESAAEREHARKADRKSRRQSAVRDIRASR